MIYRLEVEFTTHSCDDQSDVIEEQFRAFMKENKMFLRGGPVAFPIGDRLCY